MIEVRREIGRVSSIDGGETIEFRLHPQDLLCPLDLQTRRLPAPDTPGAQVRLRPSDRICERPLPLEPHAAERAVDLEHAAFTVPGELLPGQLLQQLDAAAVGEPAREPRRHHEALALGAVDDGLHVFVPDGVIVVAVDGFVTGGDADKWFHGVIGRGARSLA